MLAVPAVFGLGGRCPQGPGRGRGGRQLLEARRRHLHVRRDVPERVPLGDRRGRVAEQILDDTGFHRDPIHRGAVAVPEIVGADAVDAQLGQRQAEGAMHGGGRKVPERPEPLQLADDFQQEVAFFGIESSPSFVREPEGNGVAERFIRTLKENVLWVRSFDTIEELRLALLEFKRTYNEHWMLERYDYRSPAQVRRDLVGLDAAA